MKTSNNKDPLLTEITATTRSNISSEDSPTRFISSKGESMGLLGCNSSAEGDAAMEMD